MESSIDNVIGLGLLRQPKEVYFGPGQRFQIPRIVESLGEHALVCTDSRMADTDDFAEIARTIESRGVRVSVFAETEPDLPRSNVMALQKRYAEADVDVVIGVGGGSCLDMAKVAALVLAHGGDIRDYYGEHLVPGPGLPLLTVPTTGGTGAEVTCIAVVFDADRGMKVGVASPHLEAYAAFVDPELTLTCPPGLTAATGADALSHLIEAFTDRSKNPDAEDIQRHLYVGKNRLTDMYCRTGLELLNTSLERVAADPSDLSARADTMLAAFCAGMAINTAGTAGAHAIQSPIGNLTHTPHGFGVGALLPYIMRFNLPARVSVFAEIGRIFGVADPTSSETEQARAAIVRVEEILAALGVPLNLDALGLDPQDFQFVAEQAMLATRLTANNPRPLTAEAIIAILKHGHGDDRSWWDA
ncbi:iron-containing alcohol dehydrogenase [Sinomonas sp. JGH33]|uniref:Iron-containing alcohol dehydrogenase n=1 Tax=Sinomonas terricola TaxID=3110330 RepID=A0ABU5T6C1_9MICC|nr:iron-containing alcohol dehydrogenase [Sinomonas sp. JGH33]MEA5455221.1 iron-containing alcohol dehydrogenase [Sinomonas sp. JGH33]